jgi:hypothetical protein
MADDTVVKGSPSKGFFINMITRDIALGDAILDLLDNAVDGIKRTAGNGPAPADYASFFAEVEFSRDVFKINDNCGGIPLEIAKEYAFRFGKPDDVITAPHLIGLYGIGMKRALFKMGKVIDVSTSTGAVSYTVAIDVDDWRGQAEDDWDFPLRNVREGGSEDPVGTRITVTKLHDWIAKEFETPVFNNTLIRSIQRDYAFILDRGFRITVNGVQVDGKMPTLRVGSDIAPVKLEYADDGVQVEIVAGLAAPPPEDDSPQQRYPEQDLYGWYVVCNERVVVTADKTPLTGWGVDPVPAWHPQFFGFIGLVRFEADNAQLLPWRTTKRDVDPSSPVYKRALVKMREISKEFTEYTNRRKSELSRAREAENASKPVAVSKLSPSVRLMLPKVRDAKVRRICFDKPTAEIEAVGKALGLKVNSVKQVGIAAFDYVRDREVES